MSVDPLIITKDFLQEHPRCIFVFGDNLARRGHGGAAALRDSSNAYGFVTKIAPGTADSDYFTPETYRGVYDQEMSKLMRFIGANPHRFFLISKLGAGLANRFGIWEAVIEPQIKFNLVWYQHRIAFLYEVEAFETLRRIEEWEVSSDRELRLKREAGVINDH